MAQTVIGIFDNESEAQNAIQHLVSNGFTRSNIDLSSGSANASTSTSASSSKHDDDSIGGFFRSLFGSDNDDADRYTTVGRRSCIVTVHAQSSSEAERAADILDDFGAVDVKERSTQYSNNSSSFADTDTYNRAATTDAGTSIPIIEENLQVGKRVVETGGVRLRSRIIEKPVEENLRLREEHVHVERHAVNRPASEADLTGFQQGTIEMTEHAEVPIVNKEARVVEEVTLNKDVTEREEVIRDTVRRTDVDVENLRSDATDRTTRLDSDERRYDSDRYDADDLNKPAGL